MHERVLAVATELGATSEGYCKLEMAVSAVSEPKTIGDHWILEIVPSAP
jgi:hypothetical protein